jgi:hypothetical protein
MARCRLWTSISPAVPLAASATLRVSRSPSGKAGCALYPDEQNRIVCRSTRWGHGCTVSTEQQRVF